MDNIIMTMLLELFIIGFICIIALLIGLYFKEETTEEQKEQEEEREKDYLKLLNMTTNEILIFKDKKDFIKDVGCYDILRNFYNDDEIIKKIYPNYKRLD